MAAHLRLAADPRATGSPIRAASPIHVVLADDHTLMRRGVRMLLDDEQDVQVIAEASDLESVARGVRSHQPHVLVLDLNMPGGSSIEAIGRLRERSPDTQIVAMTMEDSAAFAQRALAAGAAGFVLKDLADTELPEAIRAAAGGEEYISPRVAPRLEALRSRMRPARSLTVLPDLREAPAAKP
jgi:two-component system, NarL family, response regulator NreC